ncbi:hypothetical protein C3L33_08887, partial [Rhododendron williamsianum]
MKNAEFDAMAKHLGYHSTVAFYYKMPGLDLDKGLVPITKDKDTTDMLNYLDKNRTAIIYLEHIGGVHCFDSAAQETDPNMQSNFDLGSFNFDPESGLEYINFDVGMFKLMDCKRILLVMLKNDDDGLYETFVDENEEFVGVRVTAEEKVEFDGNGDEIVLSDDDSKYGSKNSYYTSSDEENSHKRKHHFKNFRPETDMEDPQFKMRMLFSTPQEFKAAMKQHAIKHQRQVKMVKNDKRRIKAKCFGGTDPKKSCPWEVYAAKVMTEYMDDLRINPGMPIADLKERVRTELKVEVSRNQLYKAKRKAGKLLHGHTPVLPPKGKRKFGRPKKKRIRALEEYLNPKDPTKLRKLGQNSVYYRRCGKHGHNRRTCATPLPEASGTIVQARGRGTSVQLSARGGGGVGMQQKGRGSGVKTRGGGVGVQQRGKGNGVKVRGGGVGMQPRGRGIQV